MLGLLLGFVLSQSHGSQPLPTGKRITPVGTHIGIGSYPVNMAASTASPVAAVTDIGFRQKLTVFSTDSGKVLDQIEIKGSQQGSGMNGLYYGIAFHPRSGDLYVSRGAQDQIAVYGVSKSGKITDAGSPIVNKASKDRGVPLHPAGIAFNSNGSRLVVANNQTAEGTQFKGSVSVYDTATRGELFQIPVAGYPLDVKVLTKGPRADQIAYVASERDGLVDVVSLNQKTVLQSIAVGASPVGMVLTKAQNRLYVANSGSDTVSVIDTMTDAVVDTILVRPAELRGLPSTGPVGLSLSPDESILYVALSDFNAIGVVDTKAGVCRGYVPTGWLPTSVLSTDKSLFVTSAKGIQAQNQNGKAVNDWGQYIQNIIEGTLTTMSRPSLGGLRGSTKQVASNNFLARTNQTFKNPGIKHVIYIIKENRTYDNVLGDLAGSNGDRSLCLFPREVTPNQHALAERFVTLDNFHVCAEVSQDGWVWSTAGMVNPYASRNTPYNYSGRGRSYDTEGTNSGVPSDLVGLPDVTRPSGGYIWESTFRHGVSYRNYGFFSDVLNEEDKRHFTFGVPKENLALKKLLVENTNNNFRPYDTEYPDSDLYESYDWNYPSQLKSFGTYGSKSRFAEWKREYKQFEAKGEMPQFQMVRFGDDHTSGTRAGMPTPSSMVADNDYAVGQLVETISKGPFWKDTLICVLEDDAQGGYDHVDAHRSIAFVISPYISKGTRDSRFYNTDSMLRTMEIMLGMGPMSLYDAAASVIDVFGNEPTNALPYEAIKPSREIACQVNKPKAQFAELSSRIPRLSEESAIDERLNEILWRAVKGPNAKLPKVRTSVTGLRRAKVD